VVTVSPQRHQTGGKRRKHDMSQGRGVDGVLDGRREKHRGRMMVWRLIRESERERERTGEERDTGIPCAWFIRLQREVKAREQASFVTIPSFGRMGREDEGGPWSPGVQDRTEAGHGQDRDPRSSVDEILGTTALYSCTVPSIDSC
jgi:hypothetical protein